MTLALSAAVKVTVLMMAALGAMWGLRRRSAAARHWVLAAAVLCGLTVPALEFILPEWPLPLSSRTAATSPLTWIGELPAPGNMAATSPAGRSIATGLAGYARTGLLAVWALGTSLGLAVLVAGLFRIRQMASRSSHVSGRWRVIADEASRARGIRRPVRLLLCPHATMLVTWGTLRPSILLPAGATDWPEDRMRIVLHHELAHIGRADWVMTLAAEALRCVYWFNPLLWIACRRLRDEGERACDDLVLGSGVNGADYATHLLAVARESIQEQRLWSPAIAIARRSTLEGRVRAMLDVRLNRKPLTQSGRTATLALLVAMTLPLAVVSLSSDATVTSLIPSSRLAPVGAMNAPTIPTRRPAARRPRVAEARRAGQAFGATIEGALFDQFGGLLPGASVRLTHAETGAQQDTSTDSSGSFSFGPASPGTYELLTSLPGFATVRNVIIVAAGATVRRQIMLPLGTVNETITVVCRPGDDTGAALSPPGAAPPARRAAPPAVAAASPGGARQGNSQDPPLRIGGQIQAPRKVRDLRPVCPADIPTTTVVTLVGRIGIDGLLTDLHHDGTDAQPSFVASAMDAASQWEFSPTLLNGVPVETNIRISMEYRAPR